MRKFNIRKLKQEPQFRTFTLERSSVNEEARTVELALSSETPYTRWWGIEILGHGPGEVDLSRLLNGAALLLQHDHACQIGVIEDARLDQDRVLRCTARFSRSEKAQEVWQDVLDGIRSKVSVGYSYENADYECTKGKDGALDTYRFTNWLPYEGSIVSVPADDTVGVGRSHGARSCQNEDCTDSECDCPDCSGECSPEDKCRACTDAKKSLPTPGNARGTSPNPPAVTAGTTRKESTVDPEQIAAALAAGTITKAQHDALLRALEHPEGERNSTVEVLQLQGIAARHGLDKEAREILASKPIEEARAAILTLISERGAQPLPPLRLDMSEQEARQFSYARAVQNAVIRAGGGKAERSFEDEIHEQIERNLPANYARKGGVLIPMQLRAGLDTGTQYGGAELKFTKPGELVELLRNFCAVIQMGARVMPGLNGPVTFPKLTADAIAYWMAENGGVDVTSSAPTFGTVTLAAKILQGATAFSRSLMTQSIISIEATVRESLAFAHAKARDKAALHGTGSNNQPTGIYRTTGVNTKAMGGVPSYALLQDMITEVAADNALLGNLGWMTTAQMAGKLAQVLESSVAGAKYVWTGKRQDGEVCGYRAVSTNQVSSAMNALVDTGGSSHGLIYGNWGDVMIGEWGAMEVVVDPYSLKKQAMIEVASYEMCDVEIRHPESFCVATGATIS